LLVFPVALRDLLWVCTDSQKEESTCVRCGVDFEQTKQKKENFYSTAEEHMLFFHMLAPGTSLQQYINCLSSFWKMLFNVFWPLGVL